MATARQPLRPTTRELPLLDHLEELRWRIIYSCLAWVVGAGVAYNFRGLLMTLARHPLDAYVKTGHPVVIASLSVTEPIVVVVQLATFGGLALALPFIAYQLYRLSYRLTVGLSLLTAFDALVVWLTWREYQSKRARHDKSSVETPSNGTTTGPNPRPTDGP